MEAGGFTLVISMGIFTVCAAAWDIFTRKIPNWLTISGCVTGLFLQGYAAGVEGLLMAAGGFGTGFALTLALYCAGAVGLGDVKWFAAAGTFTGGNQIAIVLMLSVMLGGFAGGIMYLLRMPFRRKFQEIALKGACIMLSPSIQGIQYVRSLASFQVPFMLFAMAAVGCILVGLIPWL